MPTTDTDQRVGSWDANDPLYAILAVALLTHRDTLRHGPYAAQVAALDAMIGLMTTAREQAVRKGKLQGALPTKQARRQEEHRHANR